MKELSIEQKARRYDEAIKKAESLYKVSEPMSGCNVIIETLFPELKESEDERIKKELIDFVKSRLAGFHDCKRFTDWLEKQGEQKQVIDYSDSFPKDNWELIHEFVNKFGRIPKDEDELNVLIEYVLKRQKPAWSEEDVKMIGTLIAILEVNYPDGFYKVNPIDTTNMQGIHSSEIIKWLKSLRPQNTWKPTTEQLRELRCVISGCSFETSILVELEENLKKLL